ncbi:ABC transporter permease [Maledivibacter halophilus]|uniref:Nucleoside ABC transporter membrane protein n=1 Tax=Maledivibacter halophilus TaxID=36842 RepID=A0A1T5KHB8_9FIRM|nr:ABC transporter permease [Maledivibacter halophilus]SKC63050.1 nucleoside ABC transporter membrane protein [Maledivibacter halophilus]
MAIIAFLSAAVQSGTPLLFATLGEIMTEKSGNLNLGVEGMMLMGAVVGFQVGLLTSSPILALFGAAGAGALTALIFAFLTITLKTNQVVTGLSLTILGTGVSSFAGQVLIGEVVPQAIKEFFKPVEIPVIGKIPFVGEILFQHNLFIYLGYIMAIILGIYLYYTRKGLNLRMVGENPSAADASGINVDLYKYIHILIGGALCGLGGAYLSLVYVPAWQENVTAGRGWIAVALVIFATWSPYKALIGSYFFGGLDIIGFRLQKYDIKISQYIVDMLPYVVTILVLIIVSTKKGKEHMPPEGLGNPYFREER